MNNIEIYEGEINNRNMKHGIGMLSNPHYVLKGTWRNDHLLDGELNVCAMENISKANLLMVN